MTIESRINPEEDISPEKPHGRLVKIVAISGPSYGGKTRISEVLGQYLGIHPENGQEIFERRTGLETGANDRPLSTDDRFDRWQRKKFRRARKGDGEILETRLAGINRAEEDDVRADEVSKREAERKWDLQKGKEPRPQIESIPAISVLVIATKKTRVERAYQEAIRAGIQTTRTEIERLMDQRNKRNIEQWSQTHPDYVSENKDPFDPFLKRPDGTPVYDLVVRNDDIEGMPAEEAIDQAVRALIPRLALFGAFEEPQNNQPTRKMDDDILQNSGNNGTHPATA